MASAAIDVREPLLLDGNMRSEQSQTCGVTGYGPSTPLSELTTWFLVTDLGRTSSCPSPKALIEAADCSDSSRTDTVHYHVNHCPSCAQLFAAVRAAARVTALPGQFSVPLTGINLPGGSDDSPDGCQALGKIGIGVRSFASCDPEDWLADPMAMRVNLVLDEGADFLSLTLLDVPDEVTAVSIVTPRGHEAMHRAVDGAYEFVRTLQEYHCDDKQSSTFATFLNAGLVRVVFDRAADPPGFQMETNE